MSKNGAKRSAETGTRMAYTETAPHDLARGYFNVDLHRTVVRSNRANPRRAIDTI